MSRGGLCFVNGLEQAAAQDLDRLVVFGGIQQRRLACGHALGFRHAIGDELVLFVVGVARAAILADRQGIDQGGARSALNRLEQRGQEGGQLIAGAGKVAYLAQINGQFVQQDQRRFAAEQFPQRFGTGRHVPFVADANPCVAVLAGKGVGDFAPGRMRQHAVAHGPAVGRVGVLAIKGGKAHFAARQQGGIDEFPDVGNALETSGGMSQCD